MDISKLKSNRAEAKAAGDEHYFTGKTCKNGHLAPRITKRGQCVECRKEEWTKENERRKKLPKSEAAKKAGRRYYERNKELVKAKSGLQDIEKRREAKRKHKAVNRERYRIYTNTRRRRLRDASPPWLTEVQKEQIKDIYRRCAKRTEITGDRYVVDHIVPLQGDNVCGLHVPWNLQIILHTENVRKGSKLLI